MTLGEEALDEFAARILRAQDRREPLSPLSPQSGIDIPTAYLVADHVHRMRLAEGAVAVGRKIGFTNRNIWVEYDVHQPIWGWMYAHTLITSSKGCARMAIDRFAEPKIEPEIVFHFAATPAADAGPQELLACVDWIAHGFEIVQSHYPGWKFRVEDTIVDGGLHGALVLGEPVPVNRLGGAAEVVDALAAFEIDLARNDRQVEAGSGRNVLDSPLNALRHLNRVLQQFPRGAPIAAGELVTTGTLTAAYPLLPGERWSTSLRGLELPGLVLDTESA